MIDDLIQQNGSPDKSIFTYSNRQQKIRIFIADDSGVVREGLKAMLENEPDFEVIGMASDGKAAIELIEAQKPDVVLMDVEMPKQNGIESTKIISDRFPDIKVMVFSGYENNNYITQSLEAGAKGYFLKQTSQEEIVSGLKNVHKGFCQFGPGLLENYVDSIAPRKEREGKTLSNSPEEDALLLAEETKPDASLATAEEQGEIIQSQSLQARPFHERLWLRRGLIFVALSIYTLAILAWSMAKFKPELFDRLMGNPAPPAIPPTPPAPKAVSALGKIEPEGEIIELSVSAAAEGSRVEELLVKKGDRVKQGELVAILDSYNPRLADLDKAKTDVRIAQANLERVQAGAKQGDINAQQSTINRLEAELRGQVATQKAAIARLEAELSNAQTEYNRYQQLFEDGAISDSERDSKRLRVDTVKQQLAEAKETLNRTIETTNVQRDEARAKLESIAEVRTVDVGVAQAELEQAEASVKQVRAALALAQVRSPIDGQVLNINVRPGEVVGNQGIVTVGKTDRMYVLAEVYETDVDKVRLGQKAIVTSSAFADELEGEVTQIGLEVKQQDVFESDPLVNTDNKVVEVRIRLDPESSKRVTALSNLQVQVVITL